MSPHAYGCKCPQCAAMFAAILALTPQGKPFFSDDEIERLAEENDSVCDCDDCEELRMNSIRWIRFDGAGSGQQSGQRPPKSSNF